MAAPLGRVVALSLPADFERMFEDHYELVYRAAHGITGNAADAEDVVQNLFVRLMRYERPPEMSRNPRGYLYRAAINLALDLVRARQRYDTGMVAEPIVEPPDSRSADLLEWLRRSLQRLTAREAEVFVLHYFEGYSNAEIAALLGTSRATVAVTLFRARSYLKKSLRKNFGVTL